MNLIDKFNEIRLLMKSNLFRYSISFSLMLSGLFYSFISATILNSTIREIIPEILTAVGFFLIPDINTKKFVNRILSFVVVAIISVLTAIDVILIKQHVFVHGNFALYIVSLILFILLLTFYIYTSYKFIPLIFNKIKDNSNKFVKGFKLTGILIGFLISMTTLIKASIEIYEKIVE